MKTQLTTDQTAKLLGLPAEVLIAMRTQSTRSLDKRGPPYCRVIDPKSKTFKYVYDEQQIIDWCSERNIFLTANDAAWILGISRNQVLSLFGLQRYKTQGGDLIIDSARNFFMFINKRKLKIMYGRKQSKIRYKTLEKELRA